MARKPTGAGGKTVTTLKHDEAKRKNIPTAEFQSVLKAAENFSNSSHGNPVGWHRRLPEQKGSRVPSRRFELPRTATSPARSQARNPGIVTADPTILTAVSDVPAKAVNIRRIHRSTSSDSAVIIRRKPRSRSVGIRSPLPRALAPRRVRGVPSAYFPRAGMQAQSGLPGKSRSSP